jgi:hypothetical protein
MPPRWKLSEDTVKLQAYLSEQVAGAELSFEKIEEDTSVQMDLNGKAKLRTAMKRSRIEYSSIRGIGIKLADAYTVMPIMAGKTSKIVSATKRSYKSYKNLDAQFFKQLPKETQDRLMMTGTLLGIVIGSAEQYKKLYAKEQPKCINAKNITISVPEVNT